MADSNDQRLDRSYDPHARDEGANHRQRGAPANDPLAELARLIGQDDPFADFERRGRTEAPQRFQAAAPRPEPPIFHEPEANASAAASDPYPTAMATSVNAPAQAYAEQYPEGTYTPYPEQSAPHPDQAYADPPEGYEQGYDRYYAQEGQPLDDAEYHAQQERQQRRHRRSAAVVAILALAVVGGTAAYGYRTFFASGARTSPPPVIKADTTPTKMMPAAQAGNAVSNKLIYDRVSERSQVERVVPREEHPIDIKTATVSPGPRAVYSGPQAAAAKAPPPAMIPVTGARAGGQVLPVASVGSVGGGSGAILPSPKKVRTVTIRPDMTVVPSSVPSSSEPAPMPPPTAAEAARPTRPAAPPPEPRRTASASPSVAAAPPPPAPAVPARARSAPSPRQSASAPLSLAPDAAPVPRAPARSARRPMALASVPPVGNASRTSAVSGGNFAVQVSSQRSEAEANAAYRTLQRRYPNVLGGRSSFVRRADLGSRGVYYRTMVGPFATGEQAAKLCSSLKAAGGQCIIHRN